MSDEKEYIGMSEEDLQIRDLEENTDEPTVGEIRSLYYQIVDTAELLASNKEDVITICQFIVNHFPHYEDAVSCFYPHKMNLEDYKWGRAAKRLLEQVEENDDSR